MKKHFYFFLLFLFTISRISAQRDTDHWFAPYFDSHHGPSPTYYGHRLYFSTDSMTPFEVTIYSNNTVIGTVTISKGDPQYFALASQYINTTDVLSAATPINLGVYTKADKPYYVSLRICDPAHGEFVTSKGKAGLGKKFYAAAVPIGSNSSESNFTTGILATEDNTEVTVTGYDPSVSFINNPAPPPSITFILNKGQSYLLVGTGNITANQSGFIGAKITSTKPISVTNGNSNVTTGIGANNFGNDLILDQSVPVERLGNEFAMVRSLTPQTNHYDKEGGIIVATEDNTEIYLNDGGLPVAVINEGEFYRILNSGYIDQGSEHYNMYIRTTKNVYLYQLVGAQTAGSGGYNYMPPLNCFLPKKIDEIGKINEMAIFSSTNTVKLNVLTEAGATVTINSNPTTPGQGPFPLTGNTLWETYAITGIAGNVTIASTKAVTAGINGGYNTLSYGGYFAGFSSMPVISKKSGDCAPGIVLEVDDHFESYQWYLNNNPIAGAHSNTYAPIQGGDYTVVVTMGSCSATTLKYVVESCYIQTVKNLTVCENQVTITPQFSNPTYPAVSLGTITIDVSPTHGTATINPATGVVTYTPNSGFIGDDALVFHFCSDVPTLNCEQVTVHLSVDPTPVVNKAVLKSCALITNPNTALFNLEDAVITSHPGVVKKYYATMTDLNNQTNEISPTNYISPSNTIYVKVINSKGCYSVTEISLVVIQTPSSALLQDKIICIGDKTILDAGPGYDGYEWSTGETTQSILVSAGEYSVKLSKERCYIIQNVKVLVAVQPVISSIEIKNNTITVNVIGGRAPYLYSSDGVNWQESNIFTNVPRGENKIFVKDYYNCEPTHITVTVPNLINAITPNGDLKNDYLDYSELAYKQNLIFNIYDRYGNKIHEAKKFNGYKWDGTMFGKKVSTATYWYEISWTEPNKAQTITRYTGWVLVKNFE